MSSGLFYHNFLYQSISNTKCSWVSGYFLLLLSFIEIPVSNTNSVDPYQMLHSLASDMDLHCLPVPFYGKLGI